MIQTLIGKKIEQTQSFLENGKRIPVTIVSVADNIVVQVKSEEKDKYVAVQLGIGAKKKPNKAEAGHAKKANKDITPTVLREVAWSGEGDLPAVGETITVGSVFKAGDKIQVTGISKGKGFAGGVRRYNFRGGPKTHGQSDRHRAPGSIGQGTTPGRVYKGKKMAGHMGVDQVTVQNLTVVDVNEDTKTLYILGLIPGHRESVVTIVKKGEAKNFVRLLETKLKEDALAAEEAAKAKAEEEKAAAEAEKEAAKQAEETKEESVTETPSEEVAEKTEDK